MQSPKGKLIAIGGNVDKGTDPAGAGSFTYVNFFSEGILRRILKESRQDLDSRIEVITSASMIPEEIGKSYFEAFSRLGAKNIGVMNIRDRSDAQDPDMEERLRNADAVMFTGGNQLRLSSIFGGTAFHKILLKRYQEEHFVIAGTSAGAMCMSNTMIYGGESSEALMKGEVKITTGLALLSDVIVDTHFVKRGRFGRLAQAVAGNPGCIGLGLGEDTGVLITQGNHMETIGNGLVLIFDGHSIGHTNIADLPDGHPISVEGLIVHILAHGYIYLLKERAFIPGKFVVDEVE